MPYEAAHPDQPAVISCALTGVLTDPKRHPVPVTPDEMAAEAERAWNAGATVVHLHFRDQRPGMGHLPSWRTEDAVAVADAIRARVPEMLLNFSTGVIGPDISGPTACLRAGKPEIAALNAGTLNYLKLRSNGEWAWLPMVFDNPVDKVAAFVEVMNEQGIVPECECFDTGIVRSVAMFHQAGLLGDPLHISLVMGVDSGMPADPDWLPLLLREMPEGAHWQTIGIGRQEVWALHRRAAELGGHLRTGLEDTFYLPDGERARSNGDLVEALVATARAAGRQIATAAQARATFGLD
ncbi:MAG: hypothetical protein RIT45_4251 [Pseudomonadota bacterium]|jgi:uncharacterized protein (DUF849 family)